MTEPHVDARTPDRTDYDLHKEPPPDLLPPPRSSSRAIAIGILVVVVAAIAAWWFVIRPARTRQTETATQVQAPAAAPAAAAPLGATPENVDVPPLDQSDGVVRDLIRGITSDPTVVAWLATDGLVRNFTVSLVNVADGVSPQKHLSVLRPRSPFKVAGSGDRQTIDPASFHRFDPVAAAVGSIDPSAAARLYATLKPRITQAYRELGHPDEPVDRAVETAIVQLLRTPVVNGPVRVQPAPRGIGFAYTDPALESLSSAQKQLLRMGPDNVRSIQRSLRAIALALGIPASRLPPPPAI